MTPQALAAFATLVSFSRHGNRIDLKLDRGSAQIAWVSPTAFHFRRAPEGPLPDVARDSSDAVAFQVDDTPAALHLHTRLLDVALQKRGLLVEVAGPGGRVLMADLTEPRPGGWDRQAPDGVRFLGLGMLDEPEMDLRGKRIASLDPFLISSAGYGEQFLADTRFDFTAPGRYRIQTPQVDYYFFYGPKPKDIVKQRIPVAAPSLDLYRLPATWNGLRFRILETVHGAMTSPLLAHLSFTDEDKAPADLKTRIHQIASLTPGLPPFFDPSPLRRQLASFFDVYAAETRDRHYAIWRPLPFQFPDDPECARHADEFLLGDEMLVAPIYDPGDKRPVYFPPGAWTNLDTNRQYPGRRTATIESAGLPVFAHNGAIIPFDAPDGSIALHYFAPLPGEFFLLEKDPAAYSQIHAAPAGGILRLEIESKKERTYRWVIHHVDRPTQVAFEDRHYQWTYDSDRKTLTIEVPVKSAEDNIIHVTW